MLDHVAETLPGQTVIIPGARSRPPTAPASAPTSGPSPGRPQAPVPRRNLRNRVSLPSPMPWHRSLAGHLPDAARGWDADGLDDRRTRQALRTASRGGAQSDSDARAPCRACEATVEFEVRGEQRPDPRDNDLDGEGGIAGAGLAVARPAQPATISVDLLFKGRGLRSRGRVHSDHAGIAQLISEVNAPASATRETLAARDRRGY